MSSLDKLSLVNKINGYITTNNTKAITAAKTREILTDIVNTIDGSMVLDNGTLDVSDTTVYNAATRELTIPNAQPFPYVGRYTLTAPLYFNGSSYAQYAVVKSDGSSGGTSGLCYRSKVNTNLGNLLSDNTKWEFADKDGDNVGMVEILKINNFAADHNIQFEPEPTQPIITKFVATPVNNIAAGQLALDANTSVIVTGYGFLILQLRSSIIRKVGGGLLQ